MVFLSTFFGLFGIAAGLSLLVWYLCTLESFGVPYLAPLSEGGAREILRAAAPAACADKAPGSGAAYAGPALSEITR